jgi:hypothetical protein
MYDDMSRDRPTPPVTPDGDTSRDRPVDRMTVPEAADALGVTQSAIRKRVQRGSIQWDKDREGRVYVYVDPSEIGLETGPDASRDARPETGRDTARDVLVDELRDHIQFLRAELERKDTIIMTMAQRIPELEPAAEATDARQTPGEGPDRVGGPAPNAEEPEPRPSWWRRMFGA